MTDAGFGDALIPSIRDAFSRDGMLMGLSQGLQHLALHYNVDIFDEAGVEFPDADDSWTISQPS